MKRHRELAAELRIARRASLFIVLAILAAGCGMLQPTPARFRPPLPDPVPMPGIAVEDVVEQMERSGYACQFAPQSDQPASWNCTVVEGDGGPTMMITADETGPIERVFMYRLSEPGEASDVSVVDRAAAAAFRVAVDATVPEDHRPSDADLLDGVRRNYPMELGGGWFIGFDRSSTLRAMNIVFAADPGG